MPFTLLPPRSPTSKVTSELFLDAKTSDREKRRMGRTPYFKPASIQSSSDPSEGRIVFTRDVSEIGLGLLHLDPIEPQQEIVLSIELETRKLVEVGIRIGWCVPCGGGWYISGGEFCNPSK